MIFPFLSLINQFRATFVSREELNFGDVANRIATKIKKIIGMFNLFNNLTRELLAAQKDLDKFELIAMGDDHTKTLTAQKKYHSILHLIQDVITR